MFFIPMINGGHLLPIHSLQRINRPHPHLVGYLISIFDSLPSEEAYIHLMDYSNILGLHLLGSHSPTVGPPTSLW